MVRQNFFVYSDDNKGKKCLCIYNSKQACPRGLMNRKKTQSSGVEDQTAVEIGGKISSCRNQ